VSALVLLPSQYPYHSSFYHSSTAYAIVSEPQSDNGPIINDPHLGAEIIFKGGLDFPTSMAFLGPDDILVLDKNKGTVNRIVNGTMLKEPLLDVNVANKAERGMVGIAVMPKHDNNKSTYVFLYYTESKRKDGEDATLGSKSIQPLGNRLYRYELVDNNTRLINPTLLLDTPAGRIGQHNGGRLLIGPDNSVYVIIGDGSDRITQTINVQKGSPPVGTAGILRINPYGKAAQNMLDYYAYGIRNGFGIDFDPVTKNLWDTENGPNFGDEINLVKPGFNSGWIKVQGFWKSLKNHDIVSVTGTPKGLVDFKGRGKYNPPEFAWFKPTAGPTAIKFLNSDKYGKEYENDVFVGDFHNGYLYHFDLNKQRTALSLKGVLQDKIANTPDELNKGGIIFGKRFGAITDLQVGPDGYLYVLSLYQGGDNCGLKKAHKSHCIPYSSSLEGTIFRIVPTTAKTDDSNTIEAATNQNTSISNNESNITTTQHEAEKQQQQPTGIINNNSTSPSTSTTTNENTINKISIVQDAYIMADKAFSPNPATVKVGDTVTWTNDDDQPHTVTSGNGSDDPNKGKAFDSGSSALSTKGKTFKHKFTEAGQYPYFCELHPMMVGKIIVPSSSK
jgi:aldose sugar dehydrogenase